MQIILYDETLKSIWNKFVANCNTPLLLFDRNFMDYHKNYFTDNSLLCYENSELIAVFPANKQDNILYSHKGLTFGGILTKPNTKFEIKEKIIQSIIIYLQNNNIKTLVIKQLPSFLQVVPDESEVYLWNFYSTNNKISDVKEAINPDINSVIDLAKTNHWQKGKFSNIKKAIKNNIVIEKCSIIDEDYADFWHLLNTNLANRFGLKPVHSLEEIKLLANNFSNKISLFVAKKNNEIVAGTVLFDYGHCLHTQYIAANEIGKDLGATDLLISEIITEARKKYRFFSFGISNTRKGYEINKGLLEWKQGWGAEIKLHIFFKLQIS